MVNSWTVFFFFSLSFFLLGPGESNRSLYTEYGLLRYRHTPSTRETRNKSDKRILQNLVTWLSSPLMGRMCSLSDVEPWVVAMVCSSKIIVGRREFINPLFFAFPLGNPPLKADPFCASASASSTCSASLDGACASACANFVVSSSSPVNDLTRRTELSAVGRSLDRDCGRLPCSSNPFSASHSCHLRYCLSLSPPPSLGPPLRVTPTEANGPSFPCTIDDDLHLPLQSLYPSVDPTRSFPPTPFIPYSFYLPAVAPLRRRMVPKFRLCVLSVQISMHECQT